MAKTIKEISQEYASGYMNLDRQQVAEQACEYGANAVLKEIESIMDYASENYPLFHQGTIIQGHLNKLIKELKA